MARHAIKIAETSGYSTPGCRESIRLSRCIKPGQERLPRISTLRPAVDGSFEDGELRVAPGGSIEAERVIALPRLEGPCLKGLPCDRHGFLPIDELCRVGGELDVFAAGDATQFPLKQGGIAAQQADVAATGIAALAGASVEPAPFKPVSPGDWSH